MHKNVDIHLSLIVIAIAALFAAPRARAIRIVGGLKLNGDFNANPGTLVDFEGTDHWYNLGGSQTTECTRNNLTYDGTQNAVLTVNRDFALDTQYTVAEGDVFDISYVWRDAWNWFDASDQVRVVLFVTDDNTLTGVQTNLVVDLSGTSTADSTYETVNHYAIYTASAADAGKNLFVLIETDSAGFARVENFGLSTVFTQPVYLSASGSNSNDGLTPVTAWRDVNAINGKTFGPGVQILFNRGDSFSGAATLRGSGSSSQSIVVGAYGTGDKPLLTGGPNDAPIFLLDSGNEYIEFQDLQLSNFNTTNAAIPERQIIMVQPPAGSGQIDHLYFRNLDIFDLQGYGQPVHEDDHRSYAIWLKTAGDDVNPTRFNEVLCEDCTFADIDGRCFTINDASQSLADWRNQATPYFPSTNCVFQYNDAVNVYRNMVMVSGTQGFLMQYNTMDTTVEGSAFWPYNCQDTLVQFNVFKNIYAYDADGYVCHFDYNCIGTIMQYNFGFNVEGGLVEIIKAMWAGAFQEGAIARYNIGVDVGYRDRPNSAGIFFTGDVIDSQVYNNTIIQLSKPQYKAISFEDGWSGPSGWPANNVIYNNIFYAAATASTYNETDRFDDLGNVLSNNLYWGNIAPPEAVGGIPVDQNPIVGDPVFADTSKFLTTPEDIIPADLKVLFGSAAIGDGVLVTNNGGRDYFGNTVSSTTTPTLGCYEFLLRGDLTGDERVDLEDMAELGSLWQTGYEIDALLDIADNWLYGIAP